MPTPRPGSLRAIHRLFHSFSTGGVEERKAGEENLGFEGGDLTTEEFFRAIRSESDQRDSTPRRAFSTTPPAYLRPRTARSPCRRQVHIRASSARAEPPGMRSAQRANSSRAAAAVPSNASPRSPATSGRQRRARPRLATRRTASNTVATCSSWSTFDVMITTVPGHRSASPATKSSRSNPDQRGRPS